VIIDRTNFDAAQRVSFLKLAAQQGVPVHCVALHLDVSVCVKRATDRSNHEGGLQVCTGSICCAADPDCGCEAHFSSQWVVRCCC
jgi:AAA domain